MKIVLINASARKNGATSKIITEFGEILSAKTDVETTVIHLSDLRLDYCLGCCQCYKNGICHIDDDAEMLSELISNAEGVIIGTPNLVSSVPGRLKTFIDRGHFVIEQLLKNKYAISVVTYENADGKTVYKTLNKLFVLSGAKTTDKLIVKIPFNSDPLAIQSVKSSVAKKANKLYRSIQNTKSYSPINKIIQFVALNFVLKPFVLRKGNLYSGVLKHWKKRGITY